MTISHVVLGAACLTFASRLEAQATGPASALTGAVFINQIVIVLIAAGLAFVAARYWYTKTARDEKAVLVVKEATAMADRIAELERQLAAMASDVQPISAAFRAILIKQLTHFHTPVLDALMEKIGPPNTLTDEEALKLREELEKRERDMGPEIDDSERNAAKLLPLMVERMQIEAEDEEAVLQVVAVPAATAELVVAATPVAPAPKAPP